ncbi:uncharacterized protein [Salmo salar]|uniref:Uncharacterized protein n=1 Tax=Salmo salar TaxID=8030 RepID=A0A1S3SL04_SALSA|nr:uncharacterized protein LOC106610279 [Salmo salar]|eukprot:XP_014065016.1 PREDICTED: uncharacterized protein LOC106610279 isoform X2 [Salmo salar]
MEVKLTEAVIFSLLTLQVFSAERNDEAPTSWPDQGAIPTGDYLEKGRGKVHKFDRQEDHSGQSEHDVIHTLLSTNDATEIDINRDESPCKLISVMDNLPTPQIQTQPTPTTVTTNSPQLDNNKNKGKAKGAQRQVPVVPYLPIRPGAPNINGFPPAPSMFFVPQRAAARHPHPMSWFPRGYGSVPNYLMPPSVISAYVRALHGGSSEENSLSD